MQGLAIDGVNTFTYHAINNGAYKAGFTDSQAAYEAAFLHGILVDEAGLTHLAYASEIASAMLKRQQADAIIAARAKIVLGAVGMVEDALTKLAQDDIVELDDERRAAMVSNLMVVLCGEKDVHPVINAGSLYQ